MFGVHLYISVLVMLLLVIGDRCYSFVVIFLMNLTPGSKRILEMLGNNRKNIINKVIKLSLSIIMSPNKPTVYKNLGKRTSFV